MVRSVIVAMMQIATQASADSTYSSPMVRALVDRASVANRTVPDSLRAYDARVSSEMAFVARQPDGTEQPTVYQLNMMKGTQAAPPVDPVITNGGGGGYEEQVPIGFAPADESIDIGSSAFWILLGAIFAACVAANLVARMIKFGRG